MIDLHVISLAAPAGRLWIAGTARGVLRVGFGKPPSITVPGPFARHGLLTFHRHPGPLEAAVRSLKAYLGGEIATPLAELDLSGSRPFSLRVFAAVQKIPAGEMWTFDRVARAIGSPRAARAVGQALGANPVPLFVPCHRVVTKEGDIAGYIGGREWKRALLELETTQIALTPKRRRRRVRSAAQG